MALIKKKKNELSTEAAENKKNEVTPKKPKKTKLERKRARRRIYNGL